jgi:long-chain acyl-CoA synthetase
MMLPAGVFDVLRRPLQGAPDSPALVTRRVRWTYRQLDEAADRAAAALVALGVRRGDRVAASLPNEAEIVAAFHGAMRLGAIWVGVNQALAPPEKAYILADCGAAVILADDAGALALAGAGAAQAGGGAGGARPSHPARVVRPPEWADAVASASRWEGTPPDPEAPAAIAYTSGTTGYPKGAVHSQAGLVLPGAAAVARREWGPSLRKGDSLPLTILNLQVLSTLLTAQAGGLAVVMDRSDTKSIAEWIKAEAVTVWNGPPPQLWTMARDPALAPGDLASLEEVWVGGAECPDQLRFDFESRFGVRVCRTYGLTEAPALVSLDDRTGAAPPGTSGRPLDHIEVRACDGEILLAPVASGPWAGVYRPALGYWGRPDASAEVIDGRTLRTGDLGQLENGHLRIVGRRSTLIVRGGANVYPAEVERVLAEAPGVGAAAVVGLPDERLGERVAAALEPARPGLRVEPQEVAAYCRAHLAGYKVPERWVVVERLPRNPMGKVPAPAIRQLFGGKDQPEPRLDGTNMTT